MSNNLGKKAQEKLILYAQYHYQPKAMGMKPSLRLRLMIGEGMFQAYTSGLATMTTRPIELARTISARVYRSIITQASVDAEMKELSELIAVDNEGNPIPRAYGELTNDVACYEILRSQWGADTRHHDKALYKDSAYRLIEMGLKSSDSRALAGGMDRLKAVNNDFQEEAADFANTASTDIDFSSDAQLVRADAQNFSRAGIEAFKREYGRFFDKRKGGLEALLQSPDDETNLTYGGDIDPDEDTDYFEAEQVRLRRERGD